MNHGIVVEVRQRDGSGVWSVDAERAQALGLREGERPGMQNWKNGIGYSCCFRVELRKKVTLPHRKGHLR